MKKLLSLFGAIGMVATSAIVTVSCSYNNFETNIQNNASVETTIARRIGIFADTTYLSNIIDSAQLMVDANQNDPNIGPVQTALTDARTVLNNINATQNEVNVAAGNLVQAMWDFTPTANKTYLNEAIANAQLLINANLDDPNIGSVQTAQTAAQNVSNDANATQNEVNLAAENLVQAMWDFTPIANKTYLEEVNSMALALIAANPNDPNIGPVQTAQTAAQSVIDDAGATQNEVNIAAGNLVQAMWDFVPTVNKSFLEEIIQRAIIFINVRQNDPNIQPVQAALTTAQTVFNNTNANQAEVNSAYNNLNQTMIDFVPSN